MDFLKLIYSGLWHKTSTSLRDIINFISNVKAFRFRNKLSPELIRYNPEDGDSMFFEMNLFTFKATCFHNPVERNVTSLILGVCSN
jgi:hypothetical protein